MFFLARCALCIGIVAFAASRVGTEGVATAVDRSARQAVDDAGRACLRSDACLRMGAAALAAAPAAAVRLAADPLPRRPRRPETRSLRAEPGSPRAGSPGP